MLTRLSGRTAVAALLVALTVAFWPRVAARPLAQSMNASQAAAKLTGSWRLNADLTPQSTKPARGRGGSSPAVAPIPAQRGGRGGGGITSAVGGQPGDASAPLMAEEVAAQAALAVLHEVPKELTIEATADAITFREPRGEWRFAVDGKTGTMTVPGGTLRSKSRWDRATLHQEFSSAQRKLVKLWSVDANDRLVLTEKLESVAFTSESKAVFDRR